jgi:hypothetical protein
VDLKDEPAMRFRSLTHGVDLVSRALLVACAISVIVGSEPSDAGPAFPLALVVASYLLLQLLAGCWNAWVVLSPRDLDKFPRALAIEATFRAVVLLALVRDPAWSGVALSISTLLTLAVAVGYIQRANGHRSLRRQSVG